MQKIAAFITKVKARYTNGVGRKTKYGLAAIAIALVAISLLAVSMHLKQEKDDLAVKTSHTKSASSRQTAEAAPDVKSVSTDAGPQGVPTPVPSPSSSTKPSVKPNSTPSPKKGVLNMGRSSAVVRVGRNSDRFVISTADGSVQPSRLSISGGPQFLAVAIHSPLGSGQKSSSWEVSVLATSTAAPGTYNVTVVLPTPAITYEAKMVITVLPSPTFNIVSAESSTLPEIFEYVSVAINLSGDDEFFRYLAVTKVTGLPDQVFCGTSYIMSAMISMSCNNYYKVKGVYPITIEVTQNITLPPVVHSVTVDLHLYE